MPPPDFPPPMKVSPTIKLVRWSLLVGGVFYGFKRQAILAHNEIAIREEQKKKKAIRDAKLAEERRIASERDIAMLAALAGPPSAADCKCTKK